MTSKYQFDKRKQHVSETLSINEYYIPMNITFEALADYKQCGKVYVIRLIALKGSHRMNRVILLMLAINAYMLQYQTLISNYVLVMHYRCQYKRNAYVVNELKNNAIYALKTTQLLNK